MRLFCLLFLISVCYAKPNKTDVGIRHEYTTDWYSSTTTATQTNTAETTTRWSTTLPVNYLVTVRKSNVPSVDYQYDAVGILQVLLDETRNITAALPQFLKIFQLKHDSHQWKLSHACRTLLLPNGVVYLELYEHATATTIYLFE